MKDAKKLGTITLTNVRLSYPHLFKAKAIADGAPRYGANLLLNAKTDAMQIQKVKDLINTVGKEKWKDKLPKLAGKVCYKTSEPEADGSFTDGYGPDIVYVSANRAQQKGPPFVVDRTRTPLKEEDGKPYAGCYVNAVINIWAQDNDFGKRINATLEGIQFVKDGQPFGEKRLNPDEVFDDLGNEEGGLEESTNSSGTSESLV
jgi:hypothetical protein